MKQIIIIVLMILIFSGVGVAQENYEKILTEIQIDVKYIKNNIEEIKGDFKEAKADIAGLEKRVTGVEIKTDNLEKIVCNIESVNKWFLTILATIIGSLILFQYRKADKNGKKEQTN